MEDLTFIEKYILNPFRNINIELILNIEVIYILIAIIINCFLIYVLKNFKARHFMLVNDFILAPIISLFNYLIFYWYIAIPLNVFIILIMKGYMIRAAKMFYINEQNGIYSFNIRELKKINAYSFYDDNNNITYNKYKTLFPPIWLSFLMYIVLPIIVICIISSLGYKFTIIP